MPRTLEKNRSFLRPFFGVPCHPNKFLQIAYTVASLAFITNTMLTLLKKDAIRKIIQNTGLTIPRFINNKTLSLVLKCSPIILGLLFITSLLRVTCNIQNCDDMWRNTSKYSKVNNALYFSAAGITLLSMALPIYSFISETKLAPCKIYSATFSPVELMFCITSTILLIALTMSLISTVVPSLTTPQTLIYPANADQVDKYTPTTDPTPNI